MIAIRGFAAGQRRVRQAARFDLAPDWICEILSPATARLDRAEKMPRYAGHTVRWLWLIDPDLRTLEAYELRDGQWLLLTVLDEDKPVSVTPFDEIEFPLSALWA